jgi:hypothetical protein
MDAVAALGIAFQAVQLITLCNKVVQLVRTIHREGSSDADLKEKSDLLCNLSRGLETSLTSDENAHPTDQRRRLRSADAKCLSSSERMIEELDNISLKSTSDGAAAKVQRKLFSRVFRSWWGQPNVAQLEKEIHRSEQLLHSTLLTDLWYVVSSLQHHSTLMDLYPNLKSSRLSKEAAAVQQEDRFDRLDDDLQCFIRQYSQGWKQLSDLIVDQSTDIKETVILDGDKTHALVLAKETAHATAVQCNKLANSLKYETMLARKSRVAESYERTFSGSSTPILPGHGTAL